MTLGQFSVSACANQPTGFCVNGSSTPNGLLQTINGLKRLPSKEINVESTFKQRWSSTFINVVSTLIFGWKWKLSRRTFINVVSTLTKQHWNNVDRITSIQCRWTNIVSMLKFDWKWKLSQHMFIDVVSTLTKQRWNNFVNISCTEVH